MVGRLQGGRSTARGMAFKTVFASMQSSVSKCVFCWLLYLLIDDMTLTSCLCCFLLASHCQTLKTNTPVLKVDEEPIWSPTSTTTATTNEDDSTPTVATTSVPISWNTDSIDTLVSELQTNEDLNTFLLANFSGRVAGMNTWKFRCCLEQRSLQWYRPNQVRLSIC